MNILYSALTSLLVLVPNVQFGNAHVLELKANEAIDGLTSSFILIAGLPTLNHQQGNPENVLTMRVMQDAAEQLYRIYGDSGFAKSAAELQSIIDRLEALFATNPEMRITKIRGQGDLTGEQFLNSLKEKLVKIQQQELQGQIKLYFERHLGKLLTAHSRTRPDAMNSITIEQASETYKQAIAEMTKAVDELKQLFIEYPEAKNVAIQTRSNELFNANQITGLELQAITEKYIVQVTVDLKAVREKILVGFRNDLKPYTNLRPMALLQASRQQAASKNVVALRNAGDSYQSVISLLTDTIAGLTKLIGNETEFTAEVLTIENKKQSVAEHLKSFKSLLITANSEFTAYKPKWQAAKVEFDKQTKTLLVKLLKGDRKSIYNSRGLTFRFKGYSDNLNPTQLVNAFVKASTWQYVTTLTDRPNCLYTYYFQGDKLVRSEKEPEAFC